MDGKKDRTGSDMVEDLAAFAFATDDFPTSDEAHKILEEEGIDTKRLSEWTLEKLKGVRARQKLALAREKRIRWEESLERCRKSVIETGSALREAVLSQLRVLGESDPDAAQIYCRKFEEMSDEDLPELDAELSLLDSLDEDHENDG